MAFTPLSSALGDRFKGSKSMHSIQSQATAALVVEEAGRLFTELFGSIANQIRPLYIKNRTLTITCSSAAVAQEIRLRQAEIVEGINAKLGQKEVDRIRYLA